MSERKSAARAVGGQSIGGARRSVKAKPQPAPRKAPQAKRLVARIRDHDSLAGQDMRFLWLNQWDLSRRDLRRANLQGARLNGVNLSACDLRGAVLEAADLTGACLRGALLEDANFRNALVSQADFRKAKGLSEATLRVLEARGARL